MLVILCTLLKVYLPACSSHIVATSNHTRVCLHSRELLSFPTPRVVCIIMLFMCTQGSCCWSGSTLSVVCICLYNYVYVCYVHFIVCVYSSELLLELIHTQGCLYYVCTIMYMCVMCILSVYVFVCT